MHLLLLAGSMAILESFLKAFKAFLSFKLMLVQIFPLLTKQQTGHLSSDGVPLVLTKHADSVTVTKSSTGRCSGVIAKLIPLLKTFLSASFRVLLEKFFTHQSCDVFVLKFCSADFCLL